MSTTYDLACHDCQKTIWVGQRSSGQEPHWTLRPDMLPYANKFLADHLCHRLTLTSVELGYEDVLPGSYYE